ncbi:MAG: ADP-forming succinate--CoA ligase subunit beta [Lachnospiraceae bacterium]|nr:ADP-forming succinate--CoA ligase subunit beta [Lachnospiraceae bacterium]
MKIHEYQAKELLGAYGAPVPTGEIATTPAETKEAAAKYDTCVIKAQVHSGGRGKAGGVKLAHSPEEAEEIAQKMIGMTLVTHQTGPQGKVVSKVLVTEAVEVEKEFYLSITGDNERAGVVIVASADGGTEIEETAKTAPEKIVQVPVSVITGYRAFHGEQVAEIFGLEGALKKELIALLSSMYRLYVEKDCSLVEINPLVLTREGHLLCLDAKVNFDDNALYRHPELAELRDVAEEDPKEYRASQFDLNYISLDGNIGCLVNGAGLAMATMDIIQKFGGQPANFLDVGGSATKERVKAAFEILLSDPNVKAIFINIFGGIMKCDVIAEGLVAAASEMGIKVPLVVRLEGTNVDKGKEIIKNSDVAIISAEDMADGARKAVEAAKGVA